MSLISRLPLYMVTVCVVYLSLLSVSLFIMLALLLLCVYPTTERNCHSEISFRVKFRRRRKTTS
jgi:hypothetical protein